MVFTEHYKLTIQKSKQLNGRQRVRNVQRLDVPRAMRLNYEIKSLAPIAFFYTRARAHTHRGGSSPQD